jgi:hypothetical protein
MDVLYTLGKGSLYQNAEIKQSVKLLNRHVDYDRLFIIGEEPGIGGKYEFIPFKDQLTRTNNVFRKIVEVCENYDISEDFLYMMDDVFILKDSDIDHYPMYHSGELKYFPNISSYFKELNNTKLFLVKHSKPFLNYGVHCPIVYDKKKIMEIDSFYWKEVNERHNQLNPRILYGNYTEGNKVFTKDCKLIRDYPMEEIKEMLKDKEWFSIGSRSYEGNIKKYLEEL